MISLAASHKRFHHAGHIPLSSSRVSARDDEREEPYQILQRHPGSPPGVTDVGGKLGMRKVF